MSTISRHWTILVAVVFGLTLLDSVAAFGAEIVGVLTEIKGARGRVEIRANGLAEWRNVAPLLALRPGDTIRVTGDAWTVVVLVGGHGSVRVDAASSPFLVPSPAVNESVLQRVRMVADEAVKALTTRNIEPRMTPVSTRAGPKPLTIMTPRNGPVFPGPLTIEWVSALVARYTVRIESPAGLLWERRDLTEAQVAYPAEAPVLLPGIRHIVEVSGTAEPVERAWFEVLDRAWADSIGQDLSVLSDGLGPFVPSTSLAILQVAFLVEQGLLHDARARLLTALSHDTREPTLHQLLGHLYSRAGLPDLATQAYRRAERLVQHPE